MFTPPLPKHLSIAPQFQIPRNNPDDDDDDDDDPIGARLLAPHQ